MVLLLAAGVKAHEEHNPKRDHLTLRPDGVRVVLEYAIPEGEDARGLREQFDRDHSGALDDGERAQLVEYLAAQASRFVQLQIDGHRVALARVALEADAAGAGLARLGVRLVMKADVPVVGVVRFSDRHKDRQVTVPVVVTTEGGLTVAAGLAPQPFVFADHPLQFAVACDSCKKM